MNNGTTFECRRCGACCHADMVSYVREPDMRRWELEGRKDILSHVRNNELVWSGDVLVSGSGIKHYSCVFLNWDGTAFFCEIYNTRPQVCRDYLPGSSDLCPLHQVFELKK